MRHTSRLVFLAATLAASLAYAADPLPRAKPESVGMSGERLGRITAALKGDVEKGRIPGVAGQIGTAGDFSWGGAYGTNFWVDPGEHLAVVLMTHVPGEYRTTMRPMLNALVLQAIDK